MNLIPVTNRKLGLLKTVVTIASFILIITWIYTGLDKALAFEESWKALHNQTFPAWLATTLAYILPIVEVGLALFLFFSKTRWWGFLGSALLLAVFITYVGLIWVGAFPRVPCNCAGILNSVSWLEHLLINSALLLLSIFGTAYLKKVSKNPEKRDQGD